jgi:rhodanese-related sulfurtransferase
MRFVHSLEKSEIHDSLRPIQIKASRTQEANMNQWLQVFTLAMTLLSAPSFGGETLGITPDELETLRAQGVPVVDVRTPEEWRKTGIIEGSKPLMFFDSKGGYDAAAWMRRFKTIAPDAAKPVVLVCRAGNRSATVGKMLTQEQGYKRVYHLEKGLQAWMAEGHKLVPCEGC